MVIKKDASGGGYRLGGNGDPGRGFLIRTEVSITTIIAFVGLLVGGVQMATITRAEVEELNHRVEAIEGNRFTNRDASGLQTNLKLEINSFKEILIRVERRLGRIEDQQMLPGR